MDVSTTTLELQIAVTIFTMGVDLTFNAVLGKTGPLKVLG